MNTELKLSNTDYSSCFSDGISIDQFQGLPLPQILGKPHQGDISALSWYSSIEHFVFGDGGYIYGVTVYDDTLYLNWFVTAKCRFHGYAVYGEELYIQDGQVLSHYNIAKIDSEGKKILERELTVPDNSICLLSGYPPCAADYLSLNQPVFSVPVVKPPQDVTVGPKENLVYVLADTGAIYASNSSLAYVAAGCHNPPDYVALNLQQKGNNTTLYYSSGGQIISMDGNTDNFQASIYLLPAGMTSLDWIRIAINSANVQPHLVSFPQQAGLKVTFTKLNPVDAVSRFVIGIGNPQANATIFLMMEFGQGLPLIDSTGVPQNGPLATIVSSIVVNCGNSYSGVLASPSYIVQRDGNLFYIYGLFQDGQGDIIIKKIRLPNKQNSPELTAVWANAWLSHYAQQVDYCFKALNYAKNNPNLHRGCFNCGYFHRGSCDRDITKCQLPERINALNQLNNAQSNYNNALTLYNNEKATVAGLMQNIDITSKSYGIALLAWNVLKNVYQSATDRKIIGI